MRRNRNLTGGTAKSEVSETEKADSSGGKIPSGLFVIDEDNRIND